MPLPADSPLDRMSARDAAYRKLREWIMLGPLEPGEQLRDTELATRLGVSRTPVREALARLTQEGLVETHPGRRTSVSQLRFDRAPYLFGVGAVLDAFAAEEATNRLTATDLGRLEDALGRMEHSTDPKELQLLDETFHSIYYGAAANPPLVEILERITVELRRFDRVGFRNADILRAAYREHASIVHAFRMADRTAAAAAAGNNWRESWRRIERVLASSEGSKRLGELRRTAEGAAATASRGDTWGSAMQSGGA